MGDETYSVLIAVDDSKEAENALNFYLNTLHRPTTEIILLNCQDMTSTAGSYLSMGTGMESDLNLAGYQVWLDTQQKEKKKAQQLKDSLSKIMEERKITNYRFIAMSTPNVGDTIVKTSEQEKVKYIVTGTRGQGTLRRTIFGSVSDYVLHHANRPVFIFRDH